MPSEDDPATATVNRYTNLAKFGRVVFEIYEWTDRQTNRQTDI